MFTGIVQSIGFIQSIQHQDKDSRFIFNTGNMDLRDMKIGDSIATNGVCLTMIQKEKDCFTADISKQTLGLTTFSSLREGAAINLEKALQLSDRINGHMVSGHVDGTGEIVEQSSIGRSIWFSIKVPKSLSRFISEKGSIAVDGVSLTVNDMQHDVFSVNIIPHTLLQTIFSGYKIKTQVNIEVDLIARYLEQLLP